MDLVTSCFPDSHVMWSYIIIAIIAYNYTTLNLMVNVIKVTFIIYYVYYAFSDEVSVNQINYSLVVHNLLLT